MAMSRAPAVSHGTPLITNTRPVSPVPSAPDATEQRFRRLEQHVASLESRVSSLEPLTATQFVAVLAGSTAGLVFNVVELRQHAIVDPVLRGALGGDTNVRIGKRLRAVAGQHLGGFVLQRVTRDKSGVLWVVGVADLHAHAGAATDQRV